MIHDIFADAQLEQRDVRTVPSRGKKVILRVRDERVQELTLVTADAWTYGRRESPLRMPLTRNALAMVERHAQLAAAHTL